MKAILKVSGNLSIEVEAETQKELFALVGYQQEIFSKNKCGCCNGTETRFVLRNVVSGKKNYDYYEMHCLNSSCKARLSFGVLLEGDRLFPKLKDEDGKYLPNNGWHKYVAAEKKE